MDKDGSPSTGRAVRICGIHDQAHYANISSPLAQRHVLQIEPHVMTYREICRDGIYCVYVTNNVVG